MGQHGWAPAQIESETNRTDSSTTRYQHRPQRRLAVAHARRDNKTKMGQRNLEEDTPRQE